MGSSGITLGVLAALWGLFVSPTVWAFTQSGTLGNLTYTVYAPAWTWQNRDINVLVVLENNGVDPVDTRLQLVLPRGKEEHFGQLKKKKSQKKFVLKLKMEEFFALLQKKQLIKKSW